MKLEVLFKLIFPMNPLQYHNHEALADCQQTRLVWQQFEEYFKPVEEQGLRSRAQWNIEDYLISTTKSDRTFCPPSTTILIRYIGKRKHSDLEKEEQRDGVQGKAVVIPL